MESKDNSLAIVLSSWLIIAALVGIGNSIDDVSEELKQSNKINSDLAEAAKRTAGDIASLTAILRSWEITIEQNIK